MRITEEAIVAIQYILIQENIEDFFFRVGIEGNELKGMGYAVEFVKTPDLNDEIIEANGLRVVVNRLQLQHLKNLVVDYHEENDKYGIIFREEQT
jgi:iron-sulfur cluster assembly accessory protein